MGRGLAALTMVASLLAVAGPAHASTLHVSAAVTPATAKVSSVAVVSGTVSSHKAAVPLILQRLVGKHWTTLAHTKTTKGGRYAVTVRAPKKAATWVLRVTRTPAVSPVVHLRVVTKAFAVRASAPPGVASGVAVVVSGSVAPKATGTVWLQSLQGTTWHTLVSVKLTKTSTYVVTKTLPTGAYKLRVAKTFSTTVAAGSSRTLQVTVAPPVTTGPPPSAALTVVTSALPAATVGVPYTVTLAASGGTAPYTWGLAGPLPAGLSLTAGVLNGFPTATSSAAVTVVVVDAAGASTSRTLTLTVGASPAAARTIRAWGDDSHGALGDGGSTTSSTPVPVQALTGVVATAGANGAGYGLRDDGTVWAWGLNNYDQLGDGTTVNKAAPVRVLDVSAITAIAATTFGGIALRYDGTVWTWGVGVNGQLGNGSNTATSTAVQVTNLTNVIAVAGGGASGYALKSDGTVWAWGEGSGGELGDGQGMSTTTPVRVSLTGQFTAIAAGADSGYALRSDGTVWAWGLNGQGQLGDSTLVQRLSPVQVSGLTDAKAIAGNIWNGYALLTNGQVVSWGRNDVGELGDETVTARSSVPVAVHGVSGVTAIAAGALDGYALLADGTVSAWGDNSIAQLGPGSSASSSDVAVALNGLTGVLSLGAGAIAYATYAVG
ncbi:hypothetical protein acdb102_17670 [Acidothermaceae bacterium B102]|nr:hypothetical protein acdb102_17670 [Acidothermaceae bacterium B102]